VNKNRRDEKIPMPPWRQGIEGSNSDLLVSSPNQINASKTGLQIGLHGGEGEDSGWENILRSTRMAGC
jgi:hypothetical protein